MELRRRGLQSAEKGSGVADTSFKFPEDFLAKIAAGQIDREFVRELGKLTEEQRQQLARILMEQKAKRAGMN